MYFCQCRAANVKETTRTLADRHQQNQHPFMILFYTVTLAISIVAVDVTVAVAVVVDDDVTLLLHTYNVQTP